MLTGLDPRTPKRAGRTCVDMRQTIIARHLSNKCSQLKACIIAGFIYSLQYIDELRDSRKPCRTLQDDLNVAFRSVSHGRLLLEWFCGSARAQWRLTMEDSLPIGGLQPDSTHPLIADDVLAAHQTSSLATAHIFRRVRSILVFVIPRQAGQSAPACNHSPSKQSALERPNKRKYRAATGSPHAPSDTHGTKAAPPTNPLGLRAMYTT